MSLRLEMLQVARLARKPLGEAADLVRDFTLNRLHPDGGFTDRDGKPDLYYTVFGLMCLSALQADADLEPTRRWAAGFGAGDGLDLVHLACLARIHASVGCLSNAEDIEEVAARIELFRTPDGGWHVSEGNPTGTVYGSFMAFGAYQDLGPAVPRTDALIKFLKSVELDGGGFANEASMRFSTTPSTAAAVTLLRNLDAPFPPGAATDLLSRWHQTADAAGGGFLALDRAPMPDLLSTAVALHALDGMQVDFAAIRESCLDYIDSLWVNRGGFYGNWAEDTLDCEYNFYGLLALGHLSL